MPVVAESRAICLPTTTFWPLTVFLKEERKRDFALRKGKFSTNWAVLGAILSSGPWFECLNWNIFLVFSFNSAEYRQLIIRYSVLRIGEFWHSSEIYLGMSFSFGKNKRENAVQDKTTLHHVMINPECYSFESVTLPGSPYLDTSLELNIFWYFSNISLGIPDLLSQLRAEHRAGYLLDSSPITNHLAAAIFRELTSSLAKYKI